MDRIRIENLETPCIIGIRDTELQTPQRVIVNVTLHADLSSAAGKDDFSNTVDYGALSRKIIAVASNGHFKLIEALAESIASVCMENFLVQRVDVNVRKPGAILRASAASVEITRTRLQI